MDDCLDVDNAQRSSESNADVSPDGEETEDKKQSTFEGNSNSIVNAISENSTSTTKESNKIWSVADMSPKNKPVDGAIKYDDFKPSNMKDNNANSEKYDDSLCMENMEVLDSEEFKKRMHRMGKQNSVNTGKRKVSSTRKDVTKTNTQRPKEPPVMSTSKSDEALASVADKRSDALVLPAGTCLSTFDMGSFFHDLGFPEDPATKMGHGPVVFVYERKDWAAVPPTSTENLRHPVTYVNFTDTGPGSSACAGVECKTRVREIQRTHMDSLGLPDIKYNWLIGSDGAVYDGRGWMHDGHRPPEIKLGITTNCIHIAYIGDYSELSPNMTMSKTGYSLMISGCQKKYIARKAQIIERETLRPSHGLDKLFDKYMKSKKF